MVWPCDSCGCFCSREFTRRRVFIFRGYCGKTGESDWSWREADMIEFLRCTEAL